MMKTCQQTKQMNKNGKDKMTQKEHKQPREVHKQINKIFLNTYIKKKRKHVAEYMKQLWTFSFGFCKHAESISK